MSDLERIVVLAGGLSPEREVSLRSGDRVRDALAEVGIHAVVADADAAFLASVALTQPFWLADAAPTYSQILEMLTLLTLATTPVGRWGGLDFLIHFAAGRCCRSAKGT